mmetsp:Transcript_15101/g.43306  ORF Transcript_15101/g.43306 Transcript_15101/m.43306 type:complete len:87 (+) Transcript_15101:621-881(+)
MYESLKAGRTLAADEVDQKPTLCDGVAGGIEHNCVTFVHCRDVIDHHVVVSEAEVREAMKWMAESEHFIVEGAAALAVAGLVKSLR